MCGITGFWSFKAKLSSDSLKTTITEMSNQLTSRGSDSSGIWIDYPFNLAFGHRRLAIMDLSENGHQPMKSFTNRFVITYNGEIYNAQELRETLKKEGYKFKGTSDTEVILNACEAYGVEEAPKYLNGMFAYALWDTHCHQLHLVRDRMGVKPLYWGLHQDTIFFGSQLKSFYPHPFWNPKLNHNVLVNYFRFGYRAGQSSIFKDIQKLPPGCIASINSQSVIKTKSYWDLKGNIAKDIDYSLTCAQWIENLDQLLSNSVKLNMISDVATGAFLSGGIDSSTVVALMQSQSNRPVQTFTIGFKEKGYNEALHAKAVARHLGTDHTELYLSSCDAIDIIPTIPDWCDEPFGDSSQIPTFLVSRLARKDLKVCLSGDGGDELFAGYSRYFQADRYWRRICSLPLRQSIATGIHYFSPQQWDRLNKFIPGRNSHFSTGNKAYRLATFITCETRKDLYLKLVSLWGNPEDLVPGASEELPSSWLSHDTLSSSSFIEEMQYIDTKTYLPDDILAKVDYASMAVGLECRVPLLDHRVVEFAQQIPLKLKTRHPQGKWILREVLKKYVPPSLTERPKMGFGIPVDQWLRGSLRPWAEELLSINRLSEHGLLNPYPIRKRWEEHLSGSHNWHYSLWPVLMFQAWREHYKVS